MSQQTNGEMPSESAAAGRDAGHGRVNTENLVGFREDPE